MTKTEIEKRMAQQEALALERLRRSGELEANPDPVKLAEGTLTTDAPAPEPHTVATADLDGRIRLALTEQSRAPGDLAKVVGVDLELLKDALRRLVNAGHVHNVSSDQVPLYTWRVGSHASATELHQAVLRLISDGPMTADDLQQATGVALARVQSVLNQIRQDPEIRRRLLDLSADHTGAWFLPPSDPERPDAADWLADADV